MQKTLLYPLAFAVVFTGCTAFKSSQTWQSVVENREQRRTASKDKGTYFDRLHAVLTAENVEHKVVAYRFDFRNQKHEEAVASGLAVIYRDPTLKGSPWWIADETTVFPIWVPDGTPDQQVSFFLQRKAEVFAQQNFPATSGGKTFDSAPSVASPRTTPAMFAKARKPAPVRPAQPEDQFAAAFRNKHGTPFDPGSSTDRQKMAELQQTLASRSGAS
jgi:hypothetical protein